MIIGTCKLGKTQYKIFLLCLQNVNAFSRDRDRQEGRKRVKTFLIN